MTFWKKQNDSDNKSQRLGERGTGGQSIEGHSDTTLYDFKMVNMSLYICQNP